MRLGNWPVRWLAWPMSDVSITDFVGRRPPPTGQTCQKGQEKGVPTIAGYKMRVTTIYNSADEVVEKKKSFVFYVPISIYNPLILDSRSSLFYNYYIWL